MLELYHHGSSACAAKVRFALGEKGLEWVGHYVDILNGEQFRPEFLAINPKGVVPVLVDDGNVITESTVICEYLEEAFPDPPLLSARAAGASARPRSGPKPWTRSCTRRARRSLTSCRTGTRSCATAPVSFEEFMRRGAGEGAAARALKWQWIQQGLAAPGAADKIRLYASYLQKMERALQQSDWLVGQHFTMADVAMAPYVNRLAALAMEGLWRDGRLPRVADWFERVRARPTFEPAFVAWMPAALAAEMRANGVKSWPEIGALLAI